jgi:acetyl-CoA carboxylase carboxyltransferase component
MVIYLLSVIYNLFFFVFKGGGEVAKKRHVSKGKMLPRDRLMGLLDTG